MSPFRCAGCVEIDVERLHWTDLEALVAVCVSLAGLAATAWVAVVFRFNHDTPIVKASSRELTYIVLAGIFGAYLSTLPLVAAPSPAACAFGYLLPAVSFALVYGALATRTNRIARILAVSKKRIRTRRPRFLTWSAQVSVLAGARRIEQNCSCCSRGLVWQIDFECTSSGEMCE